MCFPVPYAGFFAKSQVMFFLLSLFRFCPPLKNDGTSELRSGVVLNDFLAKKKRIVNVSCPSLSGKVAALADERGKCEQKHKKYFYRTVLNTCLSFLNGRKKRSGIEE